MDPFQITSEEQLRSLIGEPSPLVVAKVSGRLNQESRKFIEAAPFVCLATTDRDGRCDVSPRGDPAGFVQVLDEKTLFLPERPGNKLADSLRNILQTGRVGLLFLIPGVGDTFRINGRAKLSNDPQYLDRCLVENKRPLLGIVVEIEEALLHCPKAMIRSGLWDPKSHQRRENLPTAGELLRENFGGDFDCATFDKERAERYRRREGFY